MTSRAEKLLLIPGLKQHKSSDEADQCIYDSESLHLKKANFVIAHFTKFLQKNILHVPPQHTLPLQEDGQPQP